MQHFLAIVKARNTEFIRDKASWAWNLIFPFILIVGFAVMFSGPEQSLYKIGELPVSQESATRYFAEFKQTRYLEQVSYDDSATALEKLRRHQLDMVIDPQTGNYWINQDAPNGYILERVLLGATTDNSQFTQQYVQGQAIRYVDWVLPGVLGMNMMFSCLFGVGYVIVRYRKNGVLKRLKATPLSAFTFLSAQVVSRLLVVMAISVFVFFSTDLLFGFFMSGSWLALLLIATLGAMSMISLGLLMASQTKSEELAGGLLNMITWPMMMLSGVWFSLEGTPMFIQNIAKLFPLTHMLDGARAVMIDGAGIAEIWLPLLVLASMTLVFLGLGAARFRWGE